MNTGMCNDCGHSDPLATRLDRGQVACASKSHASFMDIMGSHTYRRKYDTYRFIVLQSTESIGMSCEQFQARDARGRKCD